MTPVVTRMMPGLPSVASAPFSTRFMMICRIWVRSPSTIGRPIDSCSSRRTVRPLEAGVDLGRHRGSAGQVGVAEDAGEQVVEVVRDAAGEQAEAFELLRLAQL